MNLFHQEIFLYQELLECLDKERRALMETQEEAILAVAAAKETLTERLLKLKEDQESPPYPDIAAEDKDRLTNLQREVETANINNRRIIAASLEVIRDFLAQFQPPGPGTYRPEGQVHPALEGAIFHRRA